MEHILRRSLPGEKRKIAEAIVNCYGAELSALSKNQERLTNVFEEGVHTERFWVWEESNQILGIVACSDHTGRAFTPNRKKCIKSFGIVRDLIAYTIFKREFAKQLTYPETTGYIEFVGVIDSARGRGISQVLLREVICQNKQYKEFLLDVMDNNIAARRSYENLGFREVDRKPFSSGKRSGITARIYMKLRSN